MPVNEYGQMIGEPVDDTPGVLPSLVRIEGQYTIIEALSVEKHAEDLLAVYGPESPREMWTYLFHQKSFGRRTLPRLFNKSHSALQ